MWASRYGNDGLKITCSQSTGTTRPSMISNPCGVCIQLLEARIQVAEISVPSATMMVAKKCNTQKSGLEEEGSQHLICEQRPSDAAGESREIAPVGTKLVGHDQAGDDSHSEVHGEDFRPEMVKIAEDRDFLPQPQTLENDQVAREPDRDGGKDNVERDGESKLNSRQFEGT